MTKEQALIALNAIWDLIEKKSSEELVLLYFYIVEQYNLKLKSIR